MRLIYIAPMLFPVGGLERTLSDKANALVRQGHEVMFLTYNQRSEAVFYQVDSRVKQVSLQCPTFSLYRRFFITRLYHYVKLRCKFHKGMQRVVASYKPDLIVITIPNTESFIHDMFRVARGIKVIIESHLAAPFHMAGKPFTERMLCWLYPPIRSIRRADLLIALTQHDAACWLRRGVPRVRVVPNPVSFYCPDATPADKQPARIIAVGRLTAQKRFDRLIAAFALVAANHPEWTLDIFGEGELRDELTRQVEELQLQSRVRLNHATADMISQYRRSQFFVLSSDYEGFGLVITEAMACGTPVVAVDCPFGPAEIISDGETGLLARPDVDDLAEKMDWMICHESERIQMARRALQAAARYRMEPVMQEWESAYRSVGC